MCKLGAAIIGLSSINYLLINFDLYKWACQIYITHSSGSIPEAGTIFSALLFKGQPLK